MSEKLADELGNVDPSVQTFDEWLARNKSKMPLA
jgi:hypothetical protein